MFALLRIYVKFRSLITILGLGVLFYFIFFHNIGQYGLMDVDETRYVSMARDMFKSRDFLTLYLNGHYFFEKPPLYFWQECFSFAIFGKINEWSARFPVALLGCIFSFIVYLSCKKWINRHFGLYVALILATSLEFIMLSKYAILDIVLTFYIGLSLICYYQTYFCEDKNKKYYWWLFYFFVGLAVMSKGVPGFVIPFGTVFLSSVIFKNFKEVFSPKYFFVGFGIFLLVVLPWHILMFVKHDPLFFNEYIVKHHFHRFFNTANNEIGRKQSFYYYFIVILWGFIPWIFSLLSVAFYKIKHFFELNYFDKISNFDLQTIDISDKLKILAGVSTFWIILFFSLSSTKLSTYILPVYFPLSVITATFWYDYISQNKHEKYINFSVNFVGFACIAASIIGYIVSIYHPSEVLEYVSDVKWFSLLSLFLLGLSTLIFVKQRKYLWIFISYIVFMTVVSAFATEKFFEIDYKFGQKDLIEFAQYAKVHDFTISANGMSRKYSLLFYNDEIVDYNPLDYDFNAIKFDLNKKNNIVIVKNSVLKSLKNDMNIEVVKKGKRYSIIKNKI